MQTIQLLGGGNSYYGAVTGANGLGDNNIFLGHQAGFVSNRSNCYESATALGSNAMVGVNYGLVLGDTSNVLVGIGTAFPNHRLTVRGHLNLLSASTFRFQNDPFLTINEEKLTLGGDQGHRFPVEISSSLRYPIASTNEWADYVFLPSYQTMSLVETERYIRKNGHLPHVPSAEEVVANGIDAAHMDATLRRKIEELTLHAIEQQKQAHTLQQENAALKTLLVSMQKRLEKLEAKQ